MSLRRYIVILGLFACIACVRGRMVDCEKFPFHQQCRGSQTRKRFAGMADKELDERYHFKTKYPAKNNVIPDSMLWTILLENSLNNDEFSENYQVPTSRRRNRRMKSRRIAPRKDFLPDLEPIGDY